MYLLKTSKIVSSFRFYIFCKSQHKIIFLKSGQANRMSACWVFICQINQLSFWVADKILVFQKSDLNTTLYKLDIVWFHQLVNTWEWMKYLIFIHDICQPPRRSSNLSRGKALLVSLLNFVMRLCLSSNNTSKVRCRKFLPWMVIL